MMQSSIDRLSSPWEKSVVRRKKHGGLLFILGAK